jgi:cyclopropane-fatty-acyl-phospholipid synthase
MWQFYLAGGISAFKHDGHVVFQLQLTRRRDVVPPTRDYIAAAEADLRQRLGGVS